jgi:UDP-N-acetylglucosamine 2-epimerase
VHVGHDRQAIETAIDQVIADEFMDSLENIVNPYGDGNASRRIVDVLSTVELDKKLIQKQITY